MHVPLRILRNAMAETTAEELLAPAEEALRERILDGAALLFARFGRAALTASSLADALGVTPRRLRRFFADPDALLAAVLRRHLGAVMQALGLVPFDAPDRPRALLCAYLGATHHPGGGLLACHALLLRDMHLLPEDERAPIDMLRHGLLGALGLMQAPELLDILDQPWMLPNRLDAALDFVAAPPTQEQLTPADPPRRPGPLDDSNFPEDVKAAILAGDNSWFHPDKFNEAQARPRAHSRGPPY